jgi:hypothetical protein
VQFLAQSTLHEIESKAGAARGRGTPVQAILVERLGDKTDDVAS